MSIFPDAATTNAILSSLPPDEWSALRERAEIVSFPAAHILFEAGDPLTAGYFPSSGLMSAFAVLPSGDQVAVVTMGPESLVGMPVVLGIDDSPHQIRVQVASIGHLLPAAALRESFDRLPVFRALVLKRIGRIYAQVARSAACNRFHSQRQRAARWLLVISAKTAQPAVAITHDLLAQMLGGPRHAISAIIAELRALGIVEQVRGTITVVAPGDLEEIACECFRTDLDLPPGT